MWMNVLVDGPPKKQGCVCETIYIRRPHLSAELGGVE